MLPSDVADVHLSDDGRAIRIVPGPHRKGTIWVRFAQPTPPGGQIGMGETRVDVMGGPQVGLPGLDRLDVREGIVVVPPVGEAARLKALRAELDDVDAATEALLKDLGYLQER